nr:nucleotide exchange factor GrpE [Candidatus Sigynarchaeum springense]MDO8116288.1 nucleotide exchange factor GrpE [Candidatus Sigynarchaeota archaeon]
MWNRTKKSPPKLYLKRVSIASHGTCLLVTRRLGWERSTNRTKKWFGYCIGSLRRTSWSRTINQVYPEAHVHTNSWSYPLKDFPVILPKSDYDRFISNKELVIAKYEKLKMDVATIRKNMALEMEKARTLFQNQFIKQILPVIDDFYRAMRFTVSLPEKKKLKQSLLESIRSNSMMILDKILVVTGLELVLPSIDSPFDAMKATAISTRFIRDKPASIVVDVLKPGYALNGILLKPAEVVVSARPPERNQQRPDLEPSTKKSRLRWIFHK